MLKIVYNGNDAYFDGLYLSILSILRRSKETFSFYLMTGDFSYLKPKFTSLTDENEIRLKELVKSFNSENDFTKIDCRKEYDEFLGGNLSEKSHYSPYAGLHLLADKFDCFKTGKLLYLNIDIMLNKDIKEIFDIDLKDYEFAVAHDALGKYWIRKNYFNNGVVLFNMDVCIKNNVFEKARNLMKTKKMYFPDQSALNNAASHFMFFPGNEMRFNNQSRKVNDDTIVKHFCAHIVGWPNHNNIKQWDIDGVHKYLKMHTFDEDFEIFLKEKAKFNN